MGTKLFVKDNMGDFSYLESESFMALPPLQEIRKDSVVLTNLGTLLLDTPARYDKTEHHEYTFLEEKKVLLLNPTVNTVSVFLHQDAFPFLDFKSSFKLNVPVTNVTALSGSNFAGIVQTSTKNGIAIFELPAQETSERLEPKLFRSLEHKLTNLCSSSSELFSVASVAGFLRLLTFCRESLSILSTRAFSCVTREEVSLSSITCVGLSPDGAVIFAVDQHHHSLLRMEVVSGNCRYFPLLKDICLSGLTFGRETILLHEGKRTLVWTSMGMTVTTLERDVYCTRAAGSSKFLFTSGINGALTLY